MKTFVVAFLFLVGLVTDASACFSFVRTMDNQTVDAQSTVKSGKSCSIKFRSTGPIDTLRIDQRPSHGGLQTGSAGRLRYSAKAGYVGPDSFTYTRPARTRVTIRSSDRCGFRSPLRPDRRISEIGIRQLNHFFSDAFLGHRSQRSGCLHSKHARIRRPDSRFADVRQGRRALRYLFLVRWSDRGREDR